MRIYPGLLMTCVGFMLLLLLACSSSTRRKLMVTAHRGASGLAPENTIAAMLKAIDFHSDYAELDVQETKDGYLILLHDDDLNRTTNGSGAIWEKTLADLNHVDAGSWMSDEFANEPVPLLSAVMDTVEGKMKLNIELKISGHQVELERRVVKLIEEKRFVDQCVVTSFNWDSVEKVKRLNPRIRAGLIFAEFPERDIFKTDWELLSVYHKLITPEFVQKAHAAGKEVHVWTVNDPKLMKKLIDDGVDNIITNRPDILQQVLAEVGM
ncbi:glycerophosphodiester phosphodiesterase [candidate division KSB1 bacterium]|nr:glycerophosphodiester phosphodiesterase [candidate division KSB1 bacterium]